MNHQESSGQRLRRCTKSEPKSLYPPRLRPFLSEVHPETSPRAPAISRSLGSDRRRLHHLVKNHVGRKDRRPFLVVVELTPNKTHEPIQLAGRRFTRVTDHGDIDNCLLAVTRVTPRGKVRADMESRCHHSLSLGRSQSKQAHVYLPSNNDRSNHVYAKAIAAKTLATIPPASTESAIRLTRVEGTGRPDAANAGTAASAYLVGIKT